MKNKIISLTFLLIVFSLFTLNLIVPDQVISESERRKLEQFSFDKGKFEKYTLDQFVFRDKFRSFKSFVNLKVLGKLDNNGLYLEDKHILKREGDLNLKSIKNFISKTNTIIESFTQNNKIYYAIIPQKEYYQSNSIYQDFDYPELFKQLDTNINAHKIDLEGILSLDDFYYTDTHLQQGKLNPVVNKILEEMGITTEAFTYTESKLEDFKGVYYGQLGLNVETDTITYLSNDVIDSLIVNYLDDNEIKAVYTPKKENSLDKYDLFLNGASPLIKIYNPKIETNNELIIFRDSFASSISPLLAQYYQKITLVDTRYITSDNYLDLIEFKDQDVLFLYSTLIVNNSYILKD